MMEWIGDLVSRAIYREAPISIAYYFGLLVNPNELIIGGKAVSAILLSQLGASSNEIAHVPFVYLAYFSVLVCLGFLFLALWLTNKYMVKALWWYFKEEVQKIG